MIFSNKQSLLNTVYNLTNFVILIPGHPNTHSTVEKFIALETTNTQCQDSRIIALSTFNVYVANTDTLSPHVIVAQDSDETNESAPTGQLRHYILNLNYTKIFKKPFRSSICHFCGLRKYLLN